MKCPFELPITKSVNKYKDEPDGFVLVQANRKLIHTAGRNKLNLSNELDYIAKVINSHEKLMDLAKDLDSGLKYLRHTQSEPYGFGIDRLEEKLQVLKELEKQNDND